MNTPLDGFQRLLAALDRLELSYYIGGSVASSFFGLARYTNDVDFVVAMVLEDVDEFARELQSLEFYAERKMMREAIQLHRSFNVIHMPSAYKFDIFPLHNDGFSRSQLLRRRFASIEFENELIECAIASPEDVVLSKLRWFRLGGGTSEQQWNDLRGIIQVKGPELDRDYMNKWAPKLNVADLLEKLLNEKR